MREPSLGERSVECRAEPLYEHIVAAQRTLGARVQTGVFGARIVLELENDGPVTIVLD